MDYGSLWPCNAAVDTLPVSAFGKSHISYLGGSGFEVVAGNEAKKRANASKNQVHGHTMPILNSVTIPLGETVPLPFGAAEKL